MILARIVGKAVSTVKHKSLHGTRLLVADPLGAASPDPVLAMDTLGARAGDVVVLSSDGIYGREMVNDPTSPARWWVMCICDHPKEVLTLAGKKG
ncbi:MAG TPA: EutN/CcmL family microcompartment protein [Phycisphaerae bacterium]|nr:EutN/CcmL family microcompartment protein [Phycisphaerae bacterium]HRY67765.1 EutN/CcmL family microcompartment protein [Phycisphaerae bacterium]HSA25217.1 EutN/CcmL family microcompartment protein [Phycisphaerae bacterium]